MKKDWDLSEKEYLSLRDARNTIRDRYQTTSSYIESSKLKAHVKFIDVLLTQYENKNKF